MSVNRRTFVQGSALLGGGALAACATGGAVAEETDPLFNQPCVDIDEWRDGPVRHRYVHGGFRGTEARFVFYFPPSEQYEGRFFHHVTPVPVHEDSVMQGFGGEGGVGFAIASGGYAVGTNQGGTAAIATPTGTVDPSIAGYRVNAAAARYSRVLASEMYGPHRTHGYAYGGSGGAFRTIGGFENSNAWDGVVPFVMGSTMAIPNVYTVRAHAMRILKNKLPQIVDAIDPGGSGDMYAGLNEEERVALLEATRMGFPPRAWAFHDTMGLGAFAILFDPVVMLDPAYFREFWTVPGYLGANPPQSLLNDRVQHRTAVTRVVMSDEAAGVGLPAPFTGDPGADANSAWKNMTRQMGGAFPVALQLRNAPAGGDLQRASMIVQSGAAAGNALSLGGVVGNFAMIGFSPIRGPSRTAASIQSGDEVQIDNSNYLAVQTYHRHQTPTADFHVWDQFRRPDGTPIYPQRPRLLGPQFAMSASGSIPTGRFNGKMIVVETLMDYDAFPWQADWYRTKVREHLGSRFDDNFRLWYVDHATHGEEGDRTRTVGYLCVLQQALCDLSVWVERGVPAPSTTNYRVVDGQVVVPPTAAERGSIQPVVTVTANGGARADVRVGQAVSFSGIVETPPNTGSVVAAEWDFEGTGDFPVTEQVTPAPRLTLTRSYAFSRPGTYFPVLRATSQRQGDASTPYARIQNIGRVRVVVR